MKKVILSLIIFFALLSPQVVSAQGTEQNELQKEAILEENAVTPVDLRGIYAYGGLESLGQGIGYIIPTVIAVAGVLVAFYLIIGAIKFIVSEGDKASVSEAKKTITHTIIAVALLVLLFLVIRFIPEFFGLEGFKILE